MTTYICREPEEKSVVVYTEKIVYVDTLGNEHPTRDEAIEANFVRDLDGEINAIVAQDSRFNVTSRPALRHLVREFVAQNPDMVRVMLGDIGPF